MANLHIGLHMLALAKSELDFLQAFLWPYYQPHYHLTSWKSVLKASI